MSLISFDFATADTQIERLSEYLGFLTEIYGEVRHAVSPVRDMSIGETADEIYRVILNLEKIIDETEHNIRKLKKVYELYWECENKIVSDISELTVSTQPLRKSSAADINADTENIGEFSGHSVLNEEWLNNLIFG